MVPRQVYNNDMKKSLRGAGIFLPIASLPGPYGSGSFGAECRRFIDLLADHAVGYWQILPLAYGGTHFSPYQGHSPFAIHHLYIDLAELVSEELLTLEETALPRDIPQLRVNKKTLIWKNALLSQAYSNFRQGRAKHLQVPFRDFIAAHADWLPDFAVYVAMHRHFQVSWQHWPAKLRDRDPETLTLWELQLHPFIREELFIQFLLDRQWQEVRTYARGRNVKIIGDLPIYPAGDSADCWYQREYFDLDKRGYPKYVSGAPPDYFSKEGQKWGSPLYNWRRIAEGDYAWIINRFKAQFHHVDVLRIDHFLGYARFWSVPARKSARHGHWVTGPGNALFDQTKKHLPVEDFIMEDLGKGSHATARVLRRFGAPGMRVVTLEMDYVQKMTDMVTYKHPTVAYTSTHDTDTLIGKYQGLTRTRKKLIDAWWEKLGLMHLPIHLRFIAALMPTPAHLVIIPLQDVMGWGTSTRINTPGTDNSRNWSWRFRWDDIDKTSFQKLAQLLVEHSRANV